MGRAGKMAPPRSAKPTRLTPHKFFVAASSQRRSPRVRGNLLTVVRSSGVDGLLGLTAIRTMRKLTYETQQPVALGLFALSQAGGHGRIRSQAPGFSRGIYDSWESPRRSLSTFNSFPRWCISSSAIPKNFASSPCRDLSTAIKFLSSL